MARTLLIAPTIVLWRIPMKLLIAACLAAIASQLPTKALAGEVYKCKGADGRIEYTSAPCDTTKTVAGKLQTTKPSDSSDQRAREELQYYRDELIRRNAQDRQDVENRRRESDAAYARDAKDREDRAAAKRTEDFWAEKQTVHTSKGWERKSRAELVAEEERKRAEAGSRRWIERNCIAIPTGPGSSVATLSC